MDRPYVGSCCPAGYRAHGVAYRDLSTRRDEMINLTTVCVEVGGSDEVYPTGPEPLSYKSVCSAGEAFSGIACKDVTDSSMVDGCTAVCFDPRTRRRRVLPNLDFRANDKPLVETIKNRTPIVGVAWKVASSSSFYECGTVAFREARPR